jgi:hypothetical protein
VAEIYRHCDHCQDHQAPWLGSESLTDDGMGHTEPCEACARIEREVERIESLGGDN